MPELNLKNPVDKLKKLFLADKKLPLIVVLGLAGMLLILLSQFWGGAEDKSTKENALVVSEAGTEADDYAAVLEEKLGGLIASIEGVGRAKIMVTLENTGEYVYAQEEKRNVDTNIEERDGTSQKSSTKENIQQNYILMNGQKEALVKTRLEPKIRGVVIICEGADDIMVRQSVVNVVTTALNIPTTRVCVEKITP